MIHQKLYILSDSRRVGRFSNIVTVKHSHGHKYIMPAFESKSCLEYVKKTTNHPYFIVNIDMKELQSHVCKNTDLYVIKTIYCDTDTKKEVMDYHILDASASAVV